MKTKILADLEIPISVPLIIPISFKKILDAFITYIIFICDMASSYLLPY